MERTNWMHLPYAGGVWDQPYRLMKRLRICTEEIARYADDKQRLAEGMKKLRAADKR
jgi:hypothetical protein